MARSSIAIANNRGNCRKVVHIKSEEYIKETVQRVVKSKHIYRFVLQQSVKEAVQIGYFACSPSPKDLNPKVCSSAAQKEKRIVLQCRTGLLNNNED